jgi:hypothetical protein
MTDAIPLPMRKAKRPRDASPLLTTTASTLRPLCQCRHSPLLPVNGGAAAPPTRRSRIPLLKRPPHRPTNTKKIVVFDDPDPGSSLLTDIANDTRPTKRRKTIESSREPLAQKTNTRRRLMDVDLTPIQHSKEDPGASNANNNIFLRSLPALPSLPAFAPVTAAKRTLLASEQNMIVTSPALPKPPGSTMQEPLLLGFASPKVERRFATLQTLGLGPPAKIDDGTVRYKIGSNNRRPSASRVLQSVAHQPHRRSSGSHVLNTSKRRCSWLERPDTLAIRARRRGSLRNALGNPAAESTPQQTDQRLGTPMSISRLDYDGIPPIPSKPLCALSTPSWAATPHTRDALDDLSDGVSHMRMDTDVTSQLATVKPTLRLPQPDQRQPQTPLPLARSIDYVATRNGVPPRSVSYSLLALTEQRSLIPLSSETPAQTSAQTPAIPQSPVGLHNHLDLSIYPACVPSPPLSPPNSDDPLNLFLITDDTDLPIAVNVSLGAGRLSPAALPHTICQTDPVNRPGRTGRTYRARKTQRNLTGSRRGTYRSTRLTRRHPDVPMPPFSSDDPLLLVGKVRNE